ncbi:type III pantothenate kinase [Labilibacter sediminis]|nr:type III pantothenate kinase [Labilibacter sediminis]
MNLVIDQGNTFTKYGVFDKGNLIHFNSGKYLDEHEISNLVDKYHIHRILLSSVQYSNENIQSAVKNLNISPDIKLIVLDSQTPLPIKNKYETPQTLGKDRLAALVGASTTYPGDPKLVIDAGTAITIDFLSEDLQFNGGNISPGIQTRFNALHQNTKQLPLLNLSDDSPFLGTNTHKAIWSGVQNGAIFEIDGYINHFNSLNPSTKTILTGGDAYFFAKNLKNPIFVDLNLVLNGLNTILEYNAKTK